MTIYQCENCDNNMGTHCFYMSVCFMRDDRPCMFQDSKELRESQYKTLGRWSRLKIKLKKYLKGDD